MTATERVRRRWSTGAWEAVVAGLVLGALVATGCEGDEGAAPTERGAATSNATSTEAPPPRPSPYGPDGKLRESDRAVAGLRLPVGLEHLYDLDRKHSYRTSLPIDAVIGYFGPRLLTGEVDRVGKGAVYRHAVPKGVSGSAVKLDVSILPASSGTRVEIVEIRPPPPTPPDIDDIRRRLAAQPPGE